MLANPIVREWALQRFTDESYTVSVVGDFLLVHDIPYLGAGPTLKRGTLITSFHISSDQVVPPSTHQVWFQGEFPCMSNGALLEAIGHPASTAGQLAQGVTANYFLSSKPANWVRFETHCDQIRHYEDLLSFQARALDPNVTARTARMAEIKEIPTPFRYPDTASLRGAYVATSERLTLKKLAIIGLGGTGSYVLDQVAKTPAWEIHLFDGDVFELHNAFRAPGAAREEDFGTTKVRYWSEKYASMRKGLVEHPYYMTEDNVHELLGFDFVFVCIDKGSARRLISQFLCQSDIPFVDCGMDLKLDKAKTQAIFGQCRVTLCTPQQHDHFDKSAPFMDEGGDGLYDQNIQIADMNALNAVLAVIRWKQYCGFYVDQMNPHQQVYTVNQQTLTRSVQNGDSKFEANKHLIEVR